MDESGRSYTAVEPTSPKARPTSPKAPGVSFYKTAQGPRIFRGDSSGDRGMWGGLMMQCGVRVFSGALLQSVPLQCPFMPSREPCVAWRYCMPVEPPGGAWYVLV